MKIIHSADWQILESRMEAFKFCAKEYISYIKNINEPFLQVIVGDLFHRKLKTTLVEFIEMHKFINEISQYSEVIITIGNHDYNERNPTKEDTITLLSNSFNYKNVFYYKESGIFTHKNMDFYNFSFFDKKYDFEVKNPNQIKIGLYHDRLKESVTFDGKKHFIKYPSVSIFNGLDAVMMGDIHKRQSFTIGEKKYAVYSGSPYQHNMSESINDHGVVCWNITNDICTFEYVNLTNPYNHVKALYDDNELKILN